MSTVPIPEASPKKGGSRVAKKNSDVTFPKRWTSKRRVQVT